MPKCCDAPGCNRPRFSGPYCDYKAHQLLRTDSRFLRQEEAREAKKKEPKKAIRSQSKSQKERDQEYSSKVHQWKADHPVCQVEGCSNPTDDLHHKIGRGIHTNNEKFWMALCRFHHRMCKEFPLEAQRLGLIENRTINRKHEYEDI